MTTDAHTSAVQDTSPGTRIPAARDIDAELRALGYPDPIPPNAAAMAQDAPEEVLETELTRLLKDWTRSLEVGRGVIRRVREQLEAEEGVPGGNTGEGEGRNGGALRYEEGSEAGGESE